VVSFSKFVHVPVHVSSRRCCRPVRGGRRPLPPARCPAPALTARWKPSIAVATESVYLHCLSTRLDRSTCPRESLDFVCHRTMLFPPEFVSPRILRVLRKYLRDDILFVSLGIAFFWRRERNSRQIQNLRRKIR